MAPKSKINVSFIDLGRRQRLPVSDADASQRKHLVRSREGNRGRRGPLPPSYLGSRSWKKRFSLANPFEVVRATALPASVSYAAPFPDRRQGKDSTIVKGASGTNVAASVGSRGRILSRAAGTHFKQAGHPREALQRELSHQVSAGNPAYRESASGCIPRSRPPQSQRAPCGATFQSIDLLDRQNP